MQIVDVLRDHARHFAGTVEACQRQMAAAGLRAAEMFAPSRTDAARLHRASPGWQRIHRRESAVPGPQPTGRAKIRNAAFGRDAGAGEWNNDLGGSHQFSELCNPGAKIGGDHAAIPAEGRCVTGSNIE